MFNIQNTYVIKERTEVASQNSEYVTHSKVSGCGFYIKSFNENKSSEVKLSSFITLAILIQEIIAISF